MVSGHHAPALTVASLAMTTASAGERDYTVRYEDGYVFRRADVESPEDLIVSGNFHLCAIGFCDDLRAIKMVGEFNGPYSYWYVSR